MENKGTILYVEDDPISYKIAQTFLTKQGYKIQGAENREKAIKAVNENNFDLILMDLRLFRSKDSEYNVNVGLELTKEIRESHPKIPIVALTA